MSMSFDATCRGLRSARDGPVVMQFSKGKQKENPNPSKKIYKDFPYVLRASQFEIEFFKRLWGFLSFGAYEMSIYDW